MNPQLQSLFKQFSAAQQWERMTGSVMSSEEDVRLTANWKISYGGDIEQVQIAKRKLFEFLSVNNDNEECATNSSIILEIDKSSFAESTHEAYRVSAETDKVTIKGIDASGVMYGVFFLIELMRLRGAPVLKKGIISRRPTLKRRIFRSPMAFYYAEELDRIDTAYPDEYLLKMAQHGFNGIWLRGILHDLIKCKAFLEFGKKAEEHIGKLNRLIQRCRNYGIKVYLYMTEPLGFEHDSSFWEKHPDVRGTYHESQKVYALCTSNEKVKNYLRDGTHYLFKNAKGLGGLILITASEHHSHCWSHGGKNGIDCPKCGQRSPSDVISEVITLLNSGVKAADPNAEVIAWNWSWAGREDDVERKIIEALPDDVVLMADFERGGKRVTDGFEHMVDEYSLSYIGPSERFMEAAKLARERGLEFFAKMQIGVTHEIASVPYLPVLSKVAEKYKRLNELGGTGVMGCWNFGNILSRNTEIANWFSWESVLDANHERHEIHERKNSLLFGTATAEQLFTVKHSPVEGILHNIAVRDFGEKAADHVVQAWNLFSKATDHYPFDINFLYKTPINFGAAYPLLLEKVDKPMPMPWLLPEEMTYNMYLSSMESTDFGDRLEDFCQVFGPEKVVSCFKNLLEEWDEGLKLIKSAMNVVPEYLQENIAKEHAVCGAIQSQFLSLVNFIEFTLARNNLLETTDPVNRAELIEKLNVIAEYELINSHKLKQYITIEESLGFHGEAFGFFYNQDKIDDKVTKLLEVINYKLPALDNNNTTFFITKT